MYLTRGNSISFDT